MTVFIKKISIKNFKSFKDEEIEFKTPSTDSLGLNIFVGENNSGKSSLIEAINFLFEGTKKDITKIKNKDAELGKKLSVEVTFCGKLSNLIDNFCQDNKKEAFKKYIFSDGTTEFLTIKRDEDDPKSLFLYNKSNNDYKNESGIDAPFKKLFSLETISSDNNPDDEITYSSASSIIKRLLSLITEDFEEKKEYKIYKEIHEKTFNSEESSLRKEIIQLERSADDILKKQFGELKIKFNFDAFNKDELLKNSSMRVRDCFLDKEVDFEEKGEGTQRAISLCLIQIYSEKLKKHPKYLNRPKPFFLFVDEPELSLHPEAQKKLLESFKEICKTEQIFISTHSPYFLTPRLFKQVYRFQNSKEIGTRVFYDKENKLKSLQENRKFFFHHRDILFKNKVLFVEGVDDLERYSKYLEKLGKEELITYVYMLNGKDGFGTELKTFCEVFNVKALCIKDLDQLVTVITNQEGLPRRRNILVKNQELKQESQKEWFKRIHGQINFEDPSLIQAINNELENNLVLINPYEDVKSYINEDGSINAEKFEFSKKLIIFLEGGN